MTAIREVELRLMSTADAITCDTPTLGTRIDPRASANYPTISRRQTDVMVAAMACGPTRVANYQWSNGTSGQTFP